MIFLVNFGPLADRFMDRQTYRLSCIVHHHRVCPLRMLEAASLWTHCKIRFAPTSTQIKCWGWPLLLKNVTWRCSEPTFFFAYVTGINLNFGKQYLQYFSRYYFFFWYFFLVLLVQRQKYGWKAMHMSPQCIGTGGLKNIEIKALCVNLCDFNISCKIN